MKKGGGSRIRASVTLGLDDVAEAENDESLKLLYCHRGSHGRIKVPQIVRRAVLEPLEPIDWSVGQDLLSSRF